MCIYIYITIYYIAFLYHILFYHILPLNNPQWPGSATSAGVPPGVVPYPSSSLQQLLRMQVEMSSSAGGSNEMLAEWMGFPALVYPLAIEHGTGKWPN